MRRVAGSLLIALAGCHQVYCAGLHRAVTDTYAENAARQPHVDMREHARREVAPTGDRVRVFTHAAQYGGAGVDFEKTEVLRVTVRGDAGARVGWIAETTDALVVWVDAAGGCASKQSQEIDVVVPVSVHAPHLHVERAASCAGPS